MFKKLLAAAGIGGARVDTRLHQTQLHPGQLIEASVLIQGGEAAQRIDGIDLTLMTRAKVSTAQGEHFKNISLAQWRIDANFEIQPSEIQEVPFHAQLHPETPFTRLPVRNNQCQVWLATGVDIELASDPTDNDVLDILPNPVLSHILTAMDSLGFTLKKADVEQGYIRTPTFTSSSGCYQEFEFRPRRLAGYSSLNEVEISLICEEKITHVLIELDRAFRGDGYINFSVANNVSVNELHSRLRQIIR